jgi:hypothetical protein
LLKFSRLYKHAEWASVVPTTVDGIQVLTDAMSYGSDIQLNYKGSGWRDVMPYGWNSSKDGNILLMCYKDTGEIRSYRLDRINELWVHDSIMNTEENSDFDDFEIPELPDIDDIIEATEAEEGEEKPFDEALDTLNSDDDALMNMYNDFEINPDDLEEGLEDLTEEDFNNENVDEFGNSLDNEPLNNEFEDNFDNQFNDSFNEEIPNEETLDEDLNNENLNNENLSEQNEFDFNNDGSNELEDESEENKQF